MVLHLPFLDVASDQYRHGTPVSVKRDGTWEGVVMQIYDEGKYMHSAILDPCFDMSSIVTADSLGMRNAGAACSHVYIVLPVVVPIVIAMSSTLAASQPVSWPAIAFAKRPQPTAMAFKNIFSKTVPPGLMSSPDRLPKHPVKEEPTSQEPKRVGKKSETGQIFLAGAAQHMLQRQAERPNLIAQNPYAALPAIARGSSPLSGFRHTCTLQELAQLTCFLFQVVAQQVINWVPSEGLHRIWGKGESTAPRRALLYHHTLVASDSHMRALTNEERKLFARVVKEGDNIREVEAVADQAWRQDLVLQVADKIKAKVGSNGKQLVLDGLIPPLNLHLTHNQMHEQYDQKTCEAVVNLGDRGQVMKQSSTQHRGQATEPCIH